MCIQEVMPPIGCNIENFSNSRDVQLSRVKHVDSKGRRKDGGKRKRGVQNDARHNRSIKTASNSTRKVD